MPEHLPHLAAELNPKSFRVRAEHDCVDTADATDPVGTRRVGGHAFAPPNAPSRIRLDLAAASAVLIRSASARAVRLPSHVRR